MNVYIKRSWFALSSFSNRSCPIPPLMWLSLLWVVFAYRWPSSTLACLMIVSRPSDAVICLSSSSTSLSPVVRGGETWTEGALVCPTQLHTLKCLNDWYLGGLRRDNLIRDFLAVRVGYSFRSGSPAANLRHCERFAREDSHFGKALRSFWSHGVAPFEPATVQALQDLHPAGLAIVLRA